MADLACMLVRPRSVYVVALVQIDVHPDWDNAAGNLILCCQAIRSFSWIPEQEVAAYQPVVQCDIAYAADYLMNINGPFETCSVLH